MNLYLATDRGIVTLTQQAESCRCALQLAGHAAQCVAIDPLRPEWVYVGTLGKSVWRSSNAGKTWQPVGEGVKPPNILSVAVSRSERFHGLGVV